MDSAPQVYDFHFPDVVVCQHRKLKGKQFVIICDPEDVEVLKGPYNDVKSSKNGKNQKLFDLIARADLMESWQTPLVCLPLRGENNKIMVTDWKFTDTDAEQQKLIADHVNGKFVAFPNLIQGQIQVTDDHTEKTTGLNYKIIKERSGVVKLDDYITTSNKWFYQPEVMADVILAHIHLYALSAGDRNLGNILVDVDKKKLHIVDFDESRAQDSEDELFYFTQPPAKKLADVWVKNARKAYDIVLELDNFGCKNVTEDIQKRLDKARSVLESFAETSEDYTSRPRNSKKKDSDSKETTPKTKKAGTNTKTKAPRVVKPVEIVDDSNLGKMKWAGLLSKDTLSYSGYNIEALKTALSKYIQHGMTDKALMVAVEIYRLNEAGGGTSPLTVLVNRLRLSLVEDIGLADIPLVVYALKTLNPAGHKEFKTLAEIIRAMCEAKKSQLVLQMWRTYSTEEGRKYAEKNTKIPIEWEMDGALAEQDYEVYDANIDNSLYWKEEDPDVLKPYGENFLDRLKEKDPVVLCWVSMYLNKCGEKDKDGKVLKAAKRDKRASPVEILWQMLGRWDTPDKTMTDTRIMGALSDAYHGLSDGTLFLVLAVLCYIRDVKYVEHAKLSAVDVTALIDGDYELNIDEKFIPEKSPLRGRGAKKGKVIQDTNGLVNVSEEHSDKVYAEIYSKA